jgi:fermentation-respiration switch protein FrsA (DUF1100 family)
MFCLFYQKIEAFFIYYPETSLDTVPEDWKLHCEEAWFETEDGEKLHGWFFPLEGDAPIILFCHGNAGNMSHRIDNVRLLLEQNLQVFIFDYRGYGKSTGKPSEEGLYLDGLAAYDYLTRLKHIPPKKIVPFGRSLGAAVAIDLSLKRKIRSLIIESAFTSTKEMAKTIVLFKLFAFIFPAHYNNLEKISQISVPKLIFHGEKDKIVPFSMGKKLFQAAQEPKYFYPIRKAGHNDTYLFGGKTYFETLAAFVRESES